MMPIAGNAVTCSASIGNEPGASIDGPWNKRRDPSEAIHLILKSRDIYADATVKDGMLDAPKAYAGLTLEDFMTPKGEIVLFRFISQPYQKGYDGPNFSLKAGLSFTISPKVVLDHYGEMMRKSAHASFAMTEPVILIAVQNWEQDHLENPWSMAPEGMIYYETRIPKSKMTRENIMGVVAVEDFKRVVQSFQPSAVTLKQFLETLRPHIRPPG